MTEMITDTETKKQTEKLLCKLGHNTKVRWAADCASHVLSVFEDRRPDDERPRRAIKAALAWALGRLKTADARKYALAAHAAAREAGQTAAAAARAAGHAAAAAHVADHAAHAALYAAKAAAFASDPADADAAARERAWQLERLKYYAQEDGCGDI